MRDFDAFLARLQSLVADGEALAAAAALISDHRVDALVAFGVEAPGGRAIDEGTLFGIGSITKLLTGIAGLRLQERGVLDLGERVQTTVPDLVFD
ncbi:MAG TPA: serine hydrolase, partial [Acidimicrobiia bacterium]